jgi:hypothetical protein
MGGVFREIVMEWGGVDIIVTPSNKLLRRIEAQGVSPMMVLHSFSTSAPNMSGLAFVAAELLKAGGAACDEDDVYCSMITNQAHMESYVKALGEAVSPSVADAKNPEAPAVKATPKAAAKARRPRA